MCSYVWCEDYIPNIIEKRHLNQDLNLFKLQCNPCECYLDHVLLFGPFSFAVKILPSVYSLFPNI